MEIHKSAEDYLETILKLQMQNGQVRSIDIVAEMHFSKPSVSVAVANLKNALLLTVSPEGWLQLTDAGRALAEHVLERHRILTRVLVHLGVDEEIAQDDACRIEHVVSQTSFEKLKEYALRNGIL